MRIRRGFIGRALPVLLAALLLVMQFPRKIAGAELSAPLSTPEPAADAVESASGMVTTLFMNSHEKESFEPGEKAVYRFTPADSDDYIFMSFPADGQAEAVVSARLIRQSDGAEIAATDAAEGFRIACALQAEESYELEITAASAGSLAVEVMLDARGRCFENPISLPGESVRYAKTIVRARDVHWFSFVAPVDGWYSIRTEKTGGGILDTKGYLMDESGRMLAENDDILFPGDANFMIQQQLKAGETYYVRISAFSNLTGAYRLVLAMPQEGQAYPEQVTLSKDEIEISVDGEASLSASLLPENALPELVYASSNSSIVSVEPDGTVRGVAAGEAIIWVISYGEVKDSCRVTVLPVAVRGMSFAGEEVTLHAEEQLTLSPVFEPANASDQTAVYESSDESIVTVSPYGVLTGVSKGDAVIIATSSDGGFVDSVAVRVEGVRPVYRALVLGEQMYEDDARLGGVNTAQGVADMLENQSIGGAGYQVRLQLDSTRPEILEGIAAAFAGAKETDISLFYINCHGAYENGAAYIRLHDESRITVDQLEAMLRQIPGKVIVILDFCQSGAFIGAGGDFERFTDSARSAFGGGTALTTGKYTVIASAAADEDSYRRSFSSGDNENSTAAIMGRSLCEGAGWDLIYDRSVTLKADADRDKAVTVQEIYEYTRRRVMHYLDGTGAVQTVHVYPEGDQTVIFGRN